MAVNRRSFLVASFGTLVVGAPLKAGDNVGKMLMRDAAEIGRAVLRAGVVESEDNALRRALDLGPGYTTVFGRSWRGAIRQDFAVGDTVVVENWVLSRTEARLCAFAALAQPVA